MVKATRSASSKKRSLEETAKADASASPQNTAPAVDSGEAENTDADVVRAVEGEAVKPKKRRSAASNLPKLPTGTKYSAAEMRPPRLKGACRCIMSWNVAGFRAVLRKHPDAFAELVELEKADVLCIQEHKLQEKGVEDAMQAAGLDSWEYHISCSKDKLGYSGVATFCRKSTMGAPISVQYGLPGEKEDTEGRVVTLEYPNMYIVNVYVPNSGDGLKRLDYRINHWDDAFSAFVLELRKSKSVVVAGDMNCAREPIDIHNARTNLKSAGFTPEERASFQKVYIDNNFVDTFRVQHPEVYGYTYFSYRFNMREKEKGWRLDYMLVSPDLAGRCHDSFILQDFLGSDHCPIGLVLKDQQDQEAHQPA